MKVATILSMLMFILVSCSSTSANLCESGNCKPDKSCCKNACGKCEGGNSCLKSECKKCTKSEKCAPKNHKH